MRTASHLGTAAIRMLAVTLLFGVVYCGADAITARRNSRLHLYVPQELAIPLWPPAVLVYDSLYVLLLLAPFVISKKDAFRHLAVAAALAIVIAGILFLLLPAELGFARPAVTGPFAAVFGITDRVNLDYNLVPSLHVALAVLCVQAFWPVSSLSARVILALWTVALAASTLLTHQHHVLDVVTGAALAVILFRVVPRRSDAG